MLFLVSANFLCGWQNSKWTNTVSWQIFCTRLICVSFYILARLRTCIQVYSLNTLRPRQNGRHFADDTFKRIFLNQNVRNSINISLKFVPTGRIHNITSLVQIMAWHRPGDKPLSEPILVILLTHICVIRPQWVKGPTMFCWFIGELLLSRYQVFGNSLFSPKVCMWYAHVCFSVVLIMTHSNIWSGTINYGS